MAREKLLLQAIVLLIYCESPIVQPAKNNVHPFPNRLFWNRPKFKEAADDNWNVAIKQFLDTDCIENIVQKGDIAHFEQFHLFPQMFSYFFFFFSSKCKTCYTTWRKGLKKEIRALKPFSRLFLYFFSQRFCKLESKTTSVWVNYKV